MHMITEPAFLLLLKAKQGKTSIAALAKSCGVSPQFMSKVLDGTWHPGDKVAAALGFTQVIAFTRKTKALAKAKAGRKKVLAKLRPKPKTKAKAKPKAKSAAKPKAKPKAKKAAKRPIIAKKPPGKAMPRPRPRKVAKKVRPDVDKVNLASPKEDVTAAPNAA